MEWRDPIEPGLARFAKAVPLALFTANGLGPLVTPKGNTVAARLERFARSATGVLAALDTAGSTSSLLLGLVGQYGGTIDGPRLAYETASADRSEIEAAIERLCDARLAARTPGGELALTPDVVEMWDSASSSVSLSEQQAITSDFLSAVCRRLGAQPSSNRKADKIAAIAELFGDPARAAVLLDSLSDDARKLLEEMAELDGLRPIPVEALGLPLYGLRAAGPARYAHLRPQPRDPRVAAMQELSTAGLVGVAEYDARVWIWAEAWPALDRPVYGAWPDIPRPPAVAAAEQPLRVPAVVALFDRALRHWSASPPPVLKNGEWRLGKPVVRSTAKVLATSEAAVDLLARLAMTTGLLLVNEVSRSGRGRNLKLDHAWMVDPDALTTWNELPPLRKWMNLVAYWTRRSEGWGDQLLTNRLLVLWELSTLEPGSGFESAELLARWIQHRHGPVGVEAAASEAIDELRVLELVTPSGPLALTALGRLGLVDFEQVGEIEGGRSTEAVVQADLTVIAPPDLDPALLARLATLARLESDAGAMLYRLDEAAIAAAIQDGETEASIVEFLTELSSVPLAEVVERFVADAAHQAEKLSIVDAPSVLISSDPAELAAAVRIKSAKLTAVTATVAVSTLPADKLRSALARRKLSPRIVTDPSSRRQPQRAADRADRLEQEALRYQQYGSGRDNAYFQARAERLAADAADARDTSARWRKYTSFAVGIDSVVPAGSEAAAR